MNTVSLRKHAWQTVRHLFSQVVINRDFGALWFSQAISSLGDATFDATLLIWISTLTRSPTAVGGALIAVGLGIILVGPIAGVYVDRWNRRRVMIGSDLLRCALILVLLLVHTTAQLPLVYAVGFLTAAAGRFFTPAQRAAIAVLVPAEAQGRANALTQSAISAMTIVGPALGAGLFLLGGQAPAILIDAGSFLVSAGAIWLICTPLTVAPQATPSRAVSSVWRGLWEGGQIVRSSRPLRSVLLAMSLLALGGGALNALEVFFVVRNLHQPAPYIGPIISSNAIGVVIGSLLLGFFVRRSSSAWAFAGGLLGDGLVTALYAQLTSYPPALVVTAAMGICNGLLVVAAQTLLMGASDQRSLGRIFALYGTGTYGAAVVGMALFAPLAQYWNIRFLFTGIGGLILLASGIAWYGCVRHVAGSRAP